MVIAFCWGCFALLRHISRSKWQIYVRGLLFFLAAILLAAVSLYRHAAMASMTWLDPDTNLANQMFPGVGVRENLRGTFEFTYHAKHCSIEEVAKDLPDLDTYTATFDESRAVLWIEALEESTANAVLQAALRADKRTDNSAFVIRGRIRDDRGKPLVDAYVDLHHGGERIKVTGVVVRRDGTFMLALSYRGLEMVEGRCYFLSHPIPQGHRGETSTMGLRLLFCWPWRTGNGGRYHRARPLTREIKNAAKTRCVSCSCSSLEKTAKPFWLSSWPREVRGSRCLARRARSLRTWSGQVDRTSTDRSRRVVSAQAR